MEDNSENLHKDEWLNSLIGFEPVKMPLHLDKKITNAIEAKKHPYLKVTKWQMAWAIAAAILLIGINITTLVQSNKKNGKHDNQSIGAEYGFESSNLISM